MNPHPIDTYRQAVLREPECAVAHYDLAGVLAEQELFAEAVAAYSSALQLVPDFAEAHNDPGNALTAPGRIPQAIGCYRQTVRLRPDSAIAHSTLGKVLLSSGRLTEASACLQQTLRMQPDDAELHNNCGNGLMRQAHVIEAIDRFRKEFREMALRLARAPEMLRGLRTRLHTSHTTTSLFDTARFAGRIEQAYATMREIYRSGSAPCSLSVNIIIAGTNG